MAYPQTLAAGFRQRDAGHDGSPAEMAWRRAVKPFLGPPRAVRRFATMSVANVQRLIWPIRYRRR